MRFLDTNIFIRYFAGNDDAKTGACFALFQRVKEGKEPVTTSEAVIAEVTYVLSSPRLYNLSHEDITARLGPLLTLRGVHFPHKRRYARALDLYATYPFLDFEDALTVAHMESEGIREVLSYEADFDRIPGVQRVEP